MYLPNGRIRWPNDRVEWPAPFKAYEDECYPHVYLHRRLRKGRGLGAGQDYVPWIQVKIGDFSSRGKSGRFPGILTQRRHHTLSLGESNFVMLQERKANVKDIREQWPILDMNAVIKLSRELGLPLVYHKGFPEPPTVDVMVTEEVNGKLRYQAFGIKHEKDAEDPEVRRRLKLQQLWCEGQGVPWALAAKGLHDELLFEHLMKLREWHLHGFDPTVPWIEDYARLFLKAHRPNSRLMDTIADTARLLNIGFTEADLALKYCAWSKRIHVDASMPIVMNGPLLLRSR